jgi:apolipoprotein N-acyltransferase
VQASFDIAFEANPKRDADIFGRYLELSCEAVADHPNLDLVMWPESAFTGNLGDVVVEGDVEPPEDIAMTTEEYRARVQEWTDAFRRKTRNVAAILNRNRSGGAESSNSRIYLLVGTDTQHLGRGEPCRYNSALFISPEGDVLERYYKMHRVPFGEYILLGDVFPWLYRMTPMTHGIASGERPQIFELAGIKLAPSICFESTVPHLIRGQLAYLQRHGVPPDVIINVTNDGWFWGASILDFHLFCAVFRAVENRLPVLVAANTGFSAYIDADGRIVEQGPRREERVICVEVHGDGRGSCYQRFGDLPAAVCLLFCGALAVVGAATALSSWKGPKTTE